MIEIYDISLDSNRPVTAIDIAGMENVILAYVRTLTYVRENSATLPEAFLKHFWASHERMALDNKMLHADAKTQTDEQT